MLSSVKNIIPLVNSEAGLCLTPANWQEAQVEAVSYSLESLLHKPGLAILKQMTHLAKYVGWSGTLIINAANLVANKAGIYTLKSPYDGSKVSLNARDLVVLLQHLKPDAAILPQNILQDCPDIETLWIESIVPFFHANDLEGNTVKKVHGVYFNYSDSLTDEQLERWSSIPRYVMGAINPQAIDDLRIKGIQFIESDEPTKDAFMGRVYSGAGTIDLTGEETAMQFETIDAHCACLTCTQQLTKAYLSHLFQHTPLLCERFLIQHNLFWMVQKNDAKCL